MANMMKSALDRRTRITQAAFDKIRKNTGQTTYRPLEVYEKLKPEDFQIIATKYGLDETMRYIQTMEGMRMRGRNGSNN